MLIHEKSFQWGLALGKYILNVVANMINTLEAFSKHSCCLPFPEISPLSGGESREAIHSNN